MADYSDDSLPPVAAAQRFLDEHESEDTDSSTSETELQDYACLPHKVRSRLIRLLRRERFAGREDAEVAEDLWHKYILKMRANDAKGKPSKGKRTKQEILREFQKYAQVIPKLYAKEATLAYAQAVVAQERATVMEKFMKFTLEQDLTIQHVAAAMSSTKADDYIQAAYRA